jgi:acylphosphatase
MKTVRVIIAGRVQGVWFRGWTLETASHHGLDGWVRSRRDGTVEAVFRGEDEQVDAVVRACHHGPSMARVAAVRCFDYDRPVEPGFHPKPSF